MKKVLTILSVLLCSAVFAQSNVEQGLNTITKQSAEAHIAFLADDLLEGRGFGTRGAAISREYIISQLKQYGISPYKEAYKQHFQLAKSGNTVWFVEDVLDAKKTFDLYNVLGYIEGEIKDQYVIIGAHYDHLGIKNNVTGKDKIFNGADDNASGVSAVLQIARAYKENGVKPKYSVIFAFWDAEEVGVRGSEYFVRNFGDLKNIKMYMNFDMIGRNTNEEKPNLVAFFYTLDSYKQIMQQNITQYNLQLEPIYNVADNKLGGSDNRSFGRRDVPIMWYHTDGHSDYHKVTDVVEKLNWSKLVDITKSAYLNSWSVANN